MKKEFDAEHQDSFPTNNTINSRILKLRKDLGLTQPQFANRLGISQGHLHRIEKDKVAVSDKIIKQISLTLKVNEGWIKLGIGDIFYTTPPKRFDSDSFRRDSSQDNGIGLRIKKLRKKLKMTQINFARDIGISISWMRQIESMNYTISDKLLAEIANRYNASLPWLLRNEGEMFIDDSDNRKDSFPSNFEKKGFPLNQELIDWIESSEELRKELWQRKEKNRKARTIIINPDDDIQVRYEMLRAVESGQMNISEACENFGFSRETYYKYLKAYKESGIAGLITEHRGPRGHRKK